MGYHNSAVCGAFQERVEAPSAKTAMFTWYTGAANPSNQLMSIYPAELATQPIASIQLRFHILCMWEI